MGSTRLPGKVLADICGLTILERCVRRLEASGVGPVVVATTKLAADDAVVALGRALGVGVVRGPTDDVLGRYALAAESWTGRFLIRATADNPLVDSCACRRVLKWLALGADYVVETGLPVGAAVEGMTTAAVRLAAREAVDPYDREHVTPWLRRGGDRLTVYTPMAPDRLVRPDLRFTVDTPDDLAFVCRVVLTAGGHALVPLANAIGAADRLLAKERA
jgi:spore coat polysaccharide biosynthesis protein SpsF